MPEPFNQDPSFEKQFPLASVNYLLLIILFNLNFVNKYSMQLEIL